MRYVCSLCLYIYIAICIYFICRVIVASYIQYSTVVWHREMNACYVHINQHHTRTSFILVFLFSPDFIFTTLLLRTHIYITQYTHIKYITLKHVSIITKCVIELWFRVWNVYLELLHSSFCSCHITFCQSRFYTQN